MKVFLMTQKYEVIILVFTFGSRDFLRFFDQSLQCYLSIDSFFPIANIILKVEQPSVIDLEVLSLGFSKNDSKSL